MLDPGLYIVIAALVGGAGPTLAGLAAWNASRKNASQASVDIVAEHLGKHMVADEANFRALDLRMQETATTLATTTRATAAALAIKVSTESEKTQGEVMEFEQQLVNIQQTLDDQGTKGPLV